jgi:hypothetical protein
MSLQIAVAGDAPVQASTGSGAAAETVMASWGPFEDLSSHNAVVDALRPRLNVVPPMRPSDSEPHWKWV